MRKRYWLTVIISALFGALALWLVLPEAFAPASLVTLRRLTSYHYAAVALVITGWWSAAAVRFMLLSRAVGRPIRFHQGVRVTVAGIFAATVTPSGGGSGVGVALSLNRYGLSLHEAVAVTTLTLTLDLAFFTWAVPASFFYLLAEGVRLPGENLGALVVVVSLVLLALGYLVTFRLALLSRGLKRVAFLSLLRPLRRRLLRFVNELTTAHALFNGRGGLEHLSFHLLTLLTWLFHLGLLNVVAWALELGIPPLELLALQLLILVLSFAIPTPGGSGYLEAALALALKGDAPAQTLSAAVVVWRVFGYYLYFLVGPLNSFTLLARRRGPRAARVSPPDR